MIASNDRIARLQWRRVAIYHAQVIGVVIVGALAAIGFCFLLIVGFALGAGIGTGG